MSIQVYDSGGYLQIPGTPGPQSFAHVGPTAPSNPEVGQMWVPDDTYLVKSWDDGWQYPTLLNGWVDYSAASYGPARYRKTAGGLVIINAMIMNGTVGDISKPAFILPDTHKPRYIMTVPGSTWNTTDCRIIINNTQGYVNIHVGSSTWVSIVCAFLARSEFE